MTLLRGMSTTTSKVFLGPQASSGAWLERVLKPSVMMSTLILASSRKGVETKERVPSRTGRPWVPKNSVGKMLMKQPKKSFGRTLNVRVTKLAESKRNDMKVRFLKKWMISSASKMTERWCVMTLLAQISNRQSK